MHTDKTHQLHFPGRKMLIRRIDDIDAGSKEEVDTELLLLPGCSSLRDRTPRCILAMMCRLKSRKGTT